MRETTYEEKRKIALGVNGKSSKSGKTVTPQYIYNPEDMIAQYSEYLRREHLASYEEYSEASNRQRQLTAKMIADLGGKQFEYHLPAIIFFMKRYLTQH